MANSAWWVWHALAGVYFNISQRWRRPTAPGGGHECEILMKSHTGHGLFVHTWRLVGCGSLWGSAGVSVSLEVPSVDLDTELRRIFMSHTSLIFVDENPEEDVE
jgi:hypothetical protein